MSRVFSICMTLIAGASLLIPSAFARETQGAFNAFEHFDLQEDDTARKPAVADLQIRGLLICDSTPCKRPRLKADQGGQVYELDHPEQAAQMFQSGIKKVMIQGSRLQDGTLQVKKIVRL